MLHPDGAMIMGLHIEAENGRSLDYVDLFLLACTCPAFYSREIISEI